MQIIRENVQQGKKTAAFYIDMWRPKLDAGANDVGASAAGGGGGERRGGKRGGKRAKKAGGGGMFGCCAAKPSTPRRKP